MEPISIVNNLPNTCNKPEARQLGAKHVSDDQHKKFLMKLHVVQLWNMRKCLKMNATATVTPTAAAHLMTATATVMRL
jgi:hypothetical protein